MDEMYLEIAQEALQPLMEGDLSPEVVMGASLAMFQYLNRAGREDLSQRFGEIWAQVHEGDPLTPEMERLLQQAPSFLAAPAPSGTSTELPSPATLPA